MLVYCIMLITFSNTYKNTGMLHIAPANGSATWKNNAVFFIAPYFDDTKVQTPTRHCKKIALLNVGFISG